jgi:signal transduction histidine kinase
MDSLAKPLRSMIDKVSFQMQRSLFRIAQEALTNVQRHASASHVAVDFPCIAGRLHLIVTDDGRGVREATEQEGSTPRTGLGISGIKARVHQFGGEPNRTRRNHDPHCSACGPNIRIQGLRRPRLLMLFKTSKQIHFNQIQDILHVLATTPTSALHERV